MYNLSLERHELFGSSRLGDRAVDGSFARTVDISPTYQSPAEWPTQGTRGRGKTRYQLTNHLSNVLATVSDLRSPVATIDTDGDGTDDSRILDAAVIGVRDNYPFGGDIEGRTLASGNPADAYKYGFNGKEDNPAWSADAVIQDYGFKLYSPGIGRFLSIDPLTSSFPWYTPYQFAGNNPIAYIDLDGLERALAQPESDRPKLEKQTADDGIGLLEHQIFTLRAEVPKGLYNQFESLYSSTPQTINDNPLAHYQPVDVNQDGKLSVGDELDIDILGPLNGVVSVDRIDKTDNKTEIYFHALKGHPDAGNIRFTISHDDETEEITFEIYNITRLNPITSGLFGIPAAAARAAQKAQWQIVLNNAEDYLDVDATQKTQEIVKYRVTTHASNGQTTEREHIEVEREHTDLLETELDNDSSER